MKHNTYNYSTATIFIFRRGRKYIGVCLDLDIVDEDIDQNELKDRMRQRVQSYVEYVCKNEMDEALLNRPAPDEYWKMYSSYLYSLLEREKKPSLRVISTAFNDNSVETFPLKMQKV